MTNGQIAKLEELSKCYLLHGWNSWVRWKLHIVEWDSRDGEKTQLNRYETCVLRRLSHEYRHQIKAMKRNRRD